MSDLLVNILTYAALWWYTGLMLELYDGGEYV